MLAEPDTRDGGVDRPELAPDLDRRIRLHVPQVDVAGPAEEEDEDAGVVAVPRRVPPADLGPEPLQIRDRQPQSAEAADAQQLAPGHAVPCRALLVADDRDRHARVSVSGAPGAGRGFRISALSMNRA